MMNKKNIILAIFVLLISSCALFNNYEKQSDFNSIEWVDDTSFLVITFVHINDYEYEVEDYLINAKTGFVKAQESVVGYRTWHLFLRSPIMTPDDRFVWGINEDSMLTKHDLSLNVSDAFNIKVKGNIDADWDNMNIMSVINSDTLRMVKLNGPEDIQLEAKWLSDLGYEILNFNEVKYVKKNGINKWAISVDYDNPTSGEGTGTMFLSRDGNWESAELLADVCGVLSPNCIYYVQGYSVNGQNIFDVYDSLNTLVNTIMF